ncbi:MAG: hypothetical protein ACT6FE_04990 [Methanosarcinaceae archaeon]
MNNANKTRELEKKDRIYLGLVITYFIYSVLRNYLYPSYFSNIDINLSDTLYLTDLIVTVFVVGFICYYNKYFKAQSSFWGLVIDKNVWYACGFIVLAIIYFVIYYKPDSSINFFYAFFVTLSFIGYELIFRASLINFITSYIGNSKKNIFMSIIISSLVYSLVLLPIDSLSYITFATIFILGFFYHLSGNILLFVFLLAGYSVSDEYGVYVGIFSLVLYFVITLLVKAFDKKICT